MTPGLLTPRSLAETAHHESACLEAYKDSGGTWTWGIGVTDASGHTVSRYKDHPTDLQTVLSVYAWLVATRYGPQVVRAFAPYHLSEAQFAAALAFHYNTGAILKTSWPWLVKSGSPQAARMVLEGNYLNGGLLKGRRAAEAALFFDEKWAGDGKLTILPVRKPSYAPDFKHPTHAPILDALGTTLAAQA